MLDCQSAGSAHAGPGQSTHKHPQRGCCCCLACAAVAGINFDLESFKQQLSRLAMPHQQFTFGQVCAHLGSRRGTHVVLTQHTSHTVISSGHRTHVMGLIRVCAVWTNKPHLPPCFPPFLQFALNLLDDPVLASAFSVSLRTSFNQVPHAVSDPVGEFL
jgi:hypothetical protein